MATLPKPHYSPRPPAPQIWPAEGVPRLGADAAPSVAGESSLLGLHTERSVLSSQVPTSEPGLAVHIEWLSELLRRFGQWWLKADFRRSQLPMLALALGIWAISARVAWQNQESATPLLRERIAEIREARVRAAAGSVVAPVSVPARAAVPSTPTTILKTGVRKAAASPAIAPSEPAAELERGVQRESRSMASLLAASIESWFSPEPASREAVEGNPRTRVWVDLKTGLYYCPGAYHYGYRGASRGRAMLQKDAEYEYFQSATGAPCQ